MARHARRELLGAVAGEDQVGVGVDEARQDGPPVDVQAAVGLWCLAGIADPGDPAALGDEGCVMPDAEEVGGQAVAGDELADPRDQGAAHERPRTWSRASTSSRETWPMRWVPWRTTSSPPTNTWSMSAWLAQ